MEGGGENREKKTTPDVLVKGAIMDLEKKNNLSKQAHVHTTQTSTCGSVLKRVVSTLVMVVCCVKDYQVTCLPKLPLNAS